MSELRYPESGSIPDRATVRRWLVEPGQAFEAGQPLVELDTEKELIRLEAPQAGSVRQMLAQNGVTVRKGAALASLGTPGSTPGSTPGTPAPGSVASRPTAAQAEGATGASETATGVSGGGQVAATSKASAAGVAASAGPNAAGGGSSAGSSPSPEGVEGLLPILMPQAGNSMEEGTILSWRVAEGDAVQAGQILCEIETDKATMEYESPADGVIARLLAAENDVVPVKQPMALLTAPGVDVAAALASWGGGDPAGGLAEGSALPAGAQGNAAPKTPPGGGEPAAASRGTPGGTGVTAVLMPQAGNSMEEGTLLSWKVAEGESVSVGQVLCEIETDKATMEHEATEAGVLIKQVAAEGDVVAVKQPIAFLALDGADMEAAKAWVDSGGWKQSSNEPVSAAPAVSTAVSSSGSAVTGSASAGVGAAAVGGRIRATPAARKQARDRGLDIESLVAGHGFAGSGPGGRVLSTDLARLASLGRPSAGAAVSDGQVVRRSMSKMRRAIANNLVASKQNVPHFYVRQTINASNLLAFQKRNKPATGCTINDCIILGVAQVMMEYPGFRSRIEGSEVVEYPHANIGIAVGVPDGLVVPVTMEADRFPLAELAARNRRLVEDARRGKVDRMGEGQFSISNMGMFGVEEFSAIINPPESGILAVAAIREAVLVEDGALKPGRVMTMTLSADHRLVDGTLAGQFMARLRELLERPDEMFAEQIG